MSEHDRSIPADEPGVSSLKRAIAPHPSPDTGGRISRPRVVIALLLIFALSVVAVVILKATTSPPPARSDRGEVLPADPESPPVLIEYVSPLTNESAPGSFVLPDRLDMSRAELRDFGSETAPITNAFKKWHAAHGAASIDKATTNVSLRGNADETVRIADIEVIKECGEPYDGTYFAAYTQGSGDTIGIGFNLDLPTTIPQEMANTQARGLYPLDGNYFSTSTIELGPDETLTLSLGAWTEAHACSFTFRLIVATSSGSYWQEIDNRGNPFVITARASDEMDEYPLAGYEAAYVQDDVGWTRIDPSTDRG